MTPNPSREQIQLGLKVAVAVLVGVAAGFGGAHGFDIASAATAAFKAFQLGF